MHRLRRAYRIVATILIPIAVAYAIQVLQYPSDAAASRGEFALRAAVSVGVVVWVVLWSVYVAAQSQVRRAVVARVRVLQENTVPMPIVARPTGLDPEVMELGRRIARGLGRAPSMRQED